MPSLTQCNTDFIDAIVRIRLKMSRNSAVIRRKVSTSVGVWLSLVERCVRDAEAAGSNPAIPTKKPYRIRLSLIFKFGKSFGKSSILGAFRSKLAKNLAKTERLIVYARWQLNIARPAHVKAFYTPARNQSSRMAKPR